MDTHVLPLPKQPRPADALARPIFSDRDYREVKSLLARTLRAVRSPQASLRAEALLVEIIEYEIRLGAAADFDLDPHEDSDTPMGGSSRRWTDTVW
jgi:hypothetical protein